MKVGKVRVNKYLSLTYKNIIKEFSGKALALPEDIWNKLKLAWTLFFAIYGLLN